MFTRSSDENQIKYDNEPNSLRTVDDDVETVVGPSVQVEGDFASKGNILVKGTVCGNVKTDKLLTVEKGAKILANVKAANAIVSGEIQGDMKIEEKLELTESARILGDVSYQILVVQAGAVLHGRVIAKGVEGEIKIERKHPAKKVKAKEEDLEFDSAKL